MVIKEGSLVKMGDSRFVLRTWAKRYFVLTQSSLTWLKNKQQEGSLKLDGVVRVNVLAPPAHYAAAQHKRAYFDIETARGQILHLAAASMEEASAWVIAISNSAFHYAQRLASRERKVNEIVSASASDSGRPRSASLNSAATFVSDWQNKVARNARERERQRKRAASGQLDTATRLFHTYIESEDVPLSAATLEALQEQVSSEDVSSDMFDAAQREAEHLLRNSVLDAYHDECLNHVDGDALEFILSSPHHLEEFADFASKHDCEEVFNFYIEVENYRELPPDPEPDALSTDSSSSLWLPSPPLLSEILTDDEILQALLKYCRRHVSGALNDMMFVISADAFKRSLDPRHSARGRFEMARSIFDQFLRHRSARFVEVAPAIRESVETDLDEAEHFVVKLTIFDDAFRAVANRLQDRVLSGFYQSHHYHYILRERVGPPPARGSSAAEQRLRGLRIGPDSVDPKDVPDTPPATRDVFAPSRLQATFSKFVREVQANTKLRAAISAQYGPMDDDDGADDEADEEAEQQEQQRQKQEQQQQQQQQHQHEKETAAAYAAASSGRVRGDLRSRTLKPRRKKRRHRGSMDDIFAGLADTSTPPERQTSAPNPTDEPDAASSPVLAAVRPPSSRVAASGSAAGAGVFQPAAPPVRAASSHAPTSSRPRAQSELRAMPSAYTDRIPSAFSVLLGPGGKSSAQASGELQAVLQHIVMSDLFILHFLMEDLNFGRGYDMRTDELLPEELRELRQLTRAWRTTEFRDFVSTLVAILSTSNEAAIDLALRVLYITLDRKVHAGEDRGHVAPQERRKGRPATAMEDVMARLQCRHCVKVSELFVHYIKEYCSRKRFTLLIKNAVLTILLNDQRTLHLFPPARQRIAVFGASVRNPMAWPALWAGLRHAPVAIKVSTLNDVTSILVRRVLNLETLVGLPRWYAMLVPMLRPVSKMSSSSQKHQAAKVQIQDHLLSGLVLLQHHSLMKHNDFYMHLTESLCCLQEYWYNSVEALVIVQRCLAGLLDKIYAKRRLFPPSLERSAWTNLLRMVKLLRTYFLSTPMLGKSVHQNQEDGASGDKLPVWQHSRPRQLAGGVRFAPDIVSFGPHFSEQGQCTDIPIVAKSAKLLRALADEHNRHTRANMTAKELRRAQLLERESHYFYDLFSFLGALEKRRSTLTEMEISSLCSNFATGSSRQRTEVLRLLDSHTAFAPIILSAGSRVSERLRTRSVGALHGRSAPFRPTGVISFLKGSNVRRPLEPPHMSADESSSDLSSGEEDSDAERSDAEELSMLETEAELPDATSFVERMRQGSMGKFESSAFGFPTPRSARRSKSRSRLHQQLQRRQQQQQQQQRQTSPQTRPLRPEDSEPDADSDADSDAEASLTAQLLALEQPSPTASASCEAGTSANGGSPSTAPGHSIDDLSDMDHEEDDDIEWLEEAVRAAAEAAREIEAMEREQSVLAAKAAPRRSFIGRRAPQRAPILSGPPSSPKTRTSPASTPPPPTLPAGLVQPRLKHSTSGDVPSLFLSGTSSSTFRYTPPSSARRSSERHRMRSPSDS